MSDKDKTLLKTCLFSLGSYLSHKQIYLNMIEKSMPL